VPARGYDFSFSFKKRRRLMRQIAAASIQKLSGYFRACFVKSPPIVG
jgi:hypothetical protein